MAPSRRALPVGWSDMASSHSGSAPVYAALAGNALVAISKFAAGFFTGSSAMLSEGVHSLVDTGNELLMLYGMHRAALPPDRDHPLGHGRELYFWTFIVALLIFSLGAVISVYEGVDHVLDPRPFENVLINYGVLGLSAVFEGASWYVAFRRMREEKGAHGYIDAIRRSKDPTTFTVLFEDSAALIGIFIAFCAIFLGHQFSLPWFDGLGSILIGLVLAATAFFLARETKALLIGEQAFPSVQRRLVEIAEAAPAVVRVNGLTTVHLGPEQVVATLSAEFEDERTTPEIEASVQRIERKLKEELPQISALFIKPRATGEAAHRLSD